MGCCHTRRVGSESDGEPLGLDGEEHLFEQLEQVALSASSADSADEPLMCTATLRERLIVFRAGMRHNINADPDQFAEFVKQQEPEQLPRDHRRAAQWVDDVLRHAAATQRIVCPVAVYNQFKAGKSRASNSSATAISRYATAGVANNGGSSVSLSTDGCGSATTDNDNEDENRPEPEHPPGLQGYLSVATLHAVRLQRQSDEQQNQALLQQQQQRAAMAQYQANGGGSGASNSNVQGVGIDARGFFVSHSDQSGDDAPEPSMPQPRHPRRFAGCNASPTADAGVPPRPQAPASPVNDVGDGAAAGHVTPLGPGLSGRGGERGTPHSGSNPLNRRRPKNSIAPQAQPPQQQEPSYARRMLIMQAGGYRTGGAGATRGIGPRGGRPPPSRTLAEQREVNFTYSESSDNEEDCSDGEIVISPGSRPLPAAPPAAGSGGTSPHARMLDNQQQQPAPVESRAAARRSRRATRR